MRSNRKAGFTAIMVSVLFWVGCGDVFRPVANPILLPGGDPLLTAHAVVVQDNGANPGTATVLDVSGDTNVGNATVGRNPVHAGIPGNNALAYVANFDDDTVTGFSLLQPSTPGVTISLAAGSKPVFLHSMESSTMYVAESGSNKVGVIPAGVNAVTTEISVGTNPVALAETPDGRKLYCVNQGDNTVSVIDNASRTAGPTPIPVGTSPVWAAMSTDGTMLFVVNQGSNNVTVINTTTDTVVTTITVGIGPNLAFYDGRLKRVYVTNPASNELSIIRADAALPTVPTLIANVSVAAAPCSGSTPVSVTALADGTRAYVANSATNNVCVLSTTNNAFFRNVSVGTNPVSIASSSDSTKVFVANRGGGTPSTPGSTSDIRTSDDTVVATVLAPKADPTCTDPAPPAAPTCLRQSPQFVVTTR